MYSYMSISLLGEMKAKCHVLKPQSKQRPVAARMVSAALALNAPVLPPSVHVTKFPIIHTYIHPILRILR